MRSIKICPQRIIEGASILFFAALVQLFAPLYVSAATPTALSTGSGHACAIADNKVKCWGNNSSGQLGNNNYGNTSTPVNVYTRDAYSDTVKDYCKDGIAIGDACLGFTARWVYKTVQRPASPLYNKTVTSISAGEQHTCAIASARAYCWGSGGDGRLGNDSYDNSLQPVAVTTSGALRGKELIDITAGDRFSCALATDGTVACWGDNSKGQLGTGNRNSSRTPVSVLVTSDSALRDKKVKKLALLKGNAATMCVTTRDDRVTCWGENYAGQSGDGRHAESVDCQRTRPGLANQYDSLKPTAVSAPNTQSITVFGKKGSIKQMEVGYTYVTALTTANKIYWWGGATTADTCGRGSNTNAQQQNCHQAGGAGQGGCGATEYERIYFYQGHCTEKEKFIYNVTCNASSNPGPVSGPLYTGSKANALKDQPIARISGSAFTGSNLGDNTLCITNIARNLIYSTSSKVCPDPSPADMACSIKTNDQASVYCDDGSEACNTTGNVIADNYLKSIGQWFCEPVGPQPVPTGGTSWLKTGMQITAMDTGSDGYTCAIASNKTVGCWGRGDKGQLGNGEYRNSTTPVLVAGL